MSLPEKQPVRDSTKKENKRETCKSEHIGNKEMAPQITKLATDIADIHILTHPSGIHQQILVDRPCEKV